MKKITNVLIMVAIVAILTLAGCKSDVKSESADSTAVVTDSTVVVK